MKNKNNYVQFTDEAYNDFINDLNERLENYNNVDNKLKNDQKNLRAENLNLVKNRNSLEENILKIRHRIEELEIMILNNRYDLDDVEISFKTLMDSAQALNDRTKSNAILSASLSILNREIDEQVRILKSEKVRLLKKSENMINEKKSLETELEKLNKLYYDVCKKIKLNTKNEKITAKNIKTNVRNKENVNNANSACKDAYYKSENGEQFRERCFVPKEKKLKPFKK